MRNLEWLCSLSGPSRALSRPARPRDYWALDGPATLLVGLLFDRLPTLTQRGTTGSFNLQLSTPALQSAFNSRLNIERSPG